MRAERLVQASDAGHLFDVSVFDPTIPRGIVVVGMAQAGKSTFAKAIAEEWRNFDPDNEVLNYSNSDGFRGYTATILKELGHDLELPIESDVFSESLDGFVDSHSESDLAEIATSLYAAPLPNEELRNPAVNSVVAIVGNHEKVRLIIEAASADYLRNIINDPSLIQQDAQPSLTVIDSRNQHDTVEKFEHAGVVLLGSFVLTCNEEVVVARVPDAGPVETLRRRNQQDRDRRIGPMTLPEDLSPSYELAKMYSNPDMLFMVGAALVMNPESGMHIDTAIVTQEQETAALPPIFAGMLTVS